LKCISTLREVKQLTKKEDGMKKIVTILSLAVMCMTSRANTVSFTAAEGYTSGALTNFAGWSGSSNFVVNSSGSGTVSWNTNVASSQMNYTIGVATNAPGIETSMQFRMTRVAGYIAGGARSITALLIEKDAVGDNTVTDGLNDTRALFERTDATNYRLSFMNATTGGNTIVTSSVFDQALLGILANGDTSGLLELKLVLHRGATTNDWKADAILKNLTTDTVLAQVLNQSFTSTASYFTNTLYGTFSSGAAG
jgi:hypothetical protein